MYAIYLNLFPTGYEKSFQVLNFETFFINDLLLQTNFDSHVLADEITVSEITLSMNG